MVNAVQSTFEEAPNQAVTPRGVTNCFHCGERCEGGKCEEDNREFCCQGCLTVHQILTASGLAHFYDLRSHPGVRVRNGREENWSYLDEPDIQRRLTDFKDEKLTRVTFHIPTIHCVACVWLLENLFQLHSAIGRSVVNFPKREVALSFATGKISLSELVSLLASIGYEPRLNLGELERPAQNSPRRRNWLQIGIAGFAFGNIMLLSLPLYLGLDSFSGPAFRTLSGWLSLALTLPVVVYSASDYWKSALLAIRRRLITLDIPIALGLAAIYAQSVYEITTGNGPGYCDSLSGLIFFLLCGRLFQRVTYDRMVFDRDYKCFFPLSVVRKTGTREETVCISNVLQGDRLVVRNGELIPADAKLVKGTALLDYSFVTGESTPVEKKEGEYVYAGGRQIGAASEIEIIKPVSQAYLTSLWNDQAFKKEHEDQLNTLTNRYSKRFTWVVLTVAIAAGAFWLMVGNPARSIKAFTSVLIVACPCALALAAPFVLGTAQRVLAKINVFLKNGFVVERMAQVDTIVFDKTGTLTARTNLATFFPSQFADPIAGAGRLSAREESAVFSLVRHSTHPNAVQIGLSLANQSTSGFVDSFRETPGLGLKGKVFGHALVLGSRQWLAKHAISISAPVPPSGSRSYLAIDGQCRGVFMLANAVRENVRELPARLSKRYDIALLSGDNDKERTRFEGLFGNESQVLFNQSPFDKLNFIAGLQKEPKTVMMVGDGLNDAGALRQSDVGVAVIENVSSFSPASDVIMEASQVSRLAAIMSFSCVTARILRLSFGISAAYNLVGISIAAAGLLSPLVCAILMPMSSVSVVLFGCGATKWVAARYFRTPNSELPQSEIISS